MSTSDHVNYNCDPKYGEHCFSHAGPKAWNAMPAELQDLTDHSEDISV